MQVDSKFVSRHHAQLISSPEGSVLEDLNSTNGVYLNGKRVRRHKLSPGDVIKIGTHELVYSRYEAPPPAPPDDERAIRTTVLAGDEYVADAEPASDDADDPDDESDDESYSSIARGS